MQIPGYRIIRKINQGGMSTVYLAVQLSVGREVALKVMSPVLNADPVFSQRFQREANIVGQLSHPNIVSIYDIGCHKSLNYIAMDYLPGGTVHERMREGMSSFEIVRVIKEISRALEVAHNKGYVHRDIKPENILFREDGTAVLTDFGVAKALSTASRVTNAGSVVGTPHYMSPEQSRGLPIDGRSDIYSLGIVFHEMLTGVVPYQADAAVAIAIKHLTAPIPKLPVQYTGYQTLLNRMLAKKPSDRFQSAGEIATVLVGIEESLTGYSGRGTPITDTSQMSVMVLFKALLLTSLAALRLKLRQLGSFLTGWRWTPKRGLFRHPPMEANNIQSAFDSTEEQRTTVISRRSQRAAFYRYRETPIRRVGLVTRGFGLLLIAAVAWTALCVGLLRFGLPVDRYLPSAMATAIHSTASVVRGENAFPPGPVQGSADVGAAAPAPEHPATRASSADSLDPQEKRHDILPAARHSTVQAERDPEPRYALTVRSEPQNSTVRVLNIREKYRDGIELEPGRYHVEVSRPGYISERRWVQLDADDLLVDIQLRPRHIPGESLRDTLLDGELGPELVVIAPGRFTMGRKGHARLSPEREVHIRGKFAASKYEITFAAYNKFARASGADLPDDRRWGKGSRPVINVSWHDAVAYTDWLSEQTGNNYRLPTEAEWEYLARAGTSTDYWWGDADASKKANCKRGCDSDYTGFFSSQTAPVGSFPPNQFKLHDTAGNVAEWVLDCYQDHYTDAPTDGSAFTQHDCSSHPVRGGAANDDYTELSSVVRKEVEAERRSARIGFRVVREFDY